MQNGQKKIRVRSQLNIRYIYEIQKLKFIRNLKSFLIIWTILN